MECPSVGFLSLFLKVIFHRSPGNRLLCDLAVFTALHVAAAAAPVLQEKARLSLLMSAAEILWGLRESTYQAPDLSLQILDGRSFTPHSTPEARLQLFNKTSFNA